VHPIELLTDPFLVSVGVFTREIILTIFINRILRKMHLSIDWFIRRMI
jgi:hypothetical protein